MRVLRRGVLAPLVILSLLLCSCRGTSDLERAYGLSESFSGAVLDMSAEITADYGSAVYCFGIRYAGTARCCTVTVTSPAAVAGLSAEAAVSDGVTLKWDGAELFLGSLDTSGLSPLEFLPELISCMEKGLVKAAYGCKCGNEDALRIDYYADENVSFTVWFSEETSLPILAEAAADGYTVIFCEFQNVTVE